MGNNKVEPYDVAKVVVSTLAGVATAVAVGCVLGPSVADEEGVKKIFAGAGAILIGMYASREVKKMVRNDMDVYAMVAKKLAEKAQREALQQQQNVVMLNQAQVQLV